MQERFSRRPMAKKDKITDNFIIDYIHLLENVLQMEAWLKSEQLAVKEVKKAKSTVRWLMSCMKAVAERTTGMGWKFPKFHHLLHCLDDMLDYGMAQNFNSGPNESHHISMIKAPSKNTQRHRQSFTMQVGTRYCENLIIDRACYECGISKKATNRSQGIHKEGVGGAYFLISLTDQGNAVTVQFISQSTSNHADLPPRWVSRLGSICVGARGQLNSIPCHTQWTTSEGQIYRAHPNYRGKGEWYDTVLIDWGPDGVVPALVCSFIDLRLLPEDSQFEFGDSLVEEPGFYALVHSFKNPLNHLYNADEHDAMSVYLFENSTLFEYQSLLVDNEGVPQLFLARMDAITGPCFSINHFGGEEHGYLLMKRRRSEWADCFSELIEAEDEEVISVDDSAEETEEQMVMDVESDDDGDPSETIPAGGHFHGEDQNSSIASGAPDSPSIASPSEAASSSEEGPSSDEASG